VISAARATSPAQSPLEFAYANLEPVLADGLRHSHASATVEMTIAASRSISSAALREFRKIFSLPRFEEIFDGLFERNPGRAGANSKPTLKLFS
jgi:hypothetical protein